MTLNANRWTPELTLLCFVEPLDRPLVLRFVRKVHAKQHSDGEGQEDDESEEIADLQITPAAFQTHRVDEDEIEEQRHQDDEQ